MVAYASSGNGELIVHKTISGACYHNEGCGYLRRSDIEVTLEEAFVEGLQPCEICRPPIYTGDAVRGSLKKKSSSHSTNKNLGGQSTRAKASPVVTNTPPSSNENNSVIVLGVGGIIGAWMAVGGTRAAINRKKELLLRKQEYEARKKLYEESYKGRSIREIVKAPEDVVIDRNGITAIGAVTIEKPYGDLTVYVSYSGKRYHKNKGCRNAYGMTPINEYDAVLRGYTSCRLCAGNNGVEVPELYKKIPSVIRILDEFEPAEKLVN